MLTKSFEAFPQKIWLASPTMHGEELAYIEEAFRTNWVSTVGANIKAFGIAPKMSKTPGKVWRGAPSMGQDTGPLRTAQGRRGCPAGA